MAIESKERTIGGLDFEVTQLPYFRAQRLLAKLVKLAGPVLLGLATTAGREDVSGADVLASALRELKEIAPLLSNFFDRLDAKELEQLTMEILDTTRVRYQGKLVALVPHMDAIVGGDIWTGLQVQAFALSVIFGNFSSARGAIEALGRSATASRSPESNTSTDLKAVPS